MPMRRGGRPAFRKKKNENRLGMLMATLAILMVAIVVGVNSFSLVEKQKQYRQREAELSALIQKEIDREAELQDFSAYTKTKKYVEEVAKDKLGLVYENEIIFKQTN